MAMIKSSWVRSMTKMNKMILIALHYKLVLKKYERDLLLKDNKTISITFGK